MFTGIIEEIGTVRATRKIPGGVRLIIQASAVLSDLKTGDSVNVDGVCQTVVELNKDEFQVEAVGETLEKTTLGALKPGSRVNLERPLQPSGRLGGHFVQGHVNANGQITQWFKRGDNYFLEVQIPPSLMKYIVPEGSIAIDGISLTVAKLHENMVGINIIPHTARQTTLQDKKKGDRVNIEVDMLAKYIENLLFHQKQPVTLNKLKQWGY